MDLSFDAPNTYLLPTLPLVVAHRGASRYAPENSVAAAEMAIDQGADMIEMDIRQTADGVLVACHDPLLDGHPVRELPYGLVREIVPEIATFDELLRITAGRALLDVEIKEEGYEAAAVEALAGHGLLGDAVVTSFSTQAIKTVKELDPSTRTGWIVDGPWGADVLTRFAETGADWLVAETASLTPGLIAGIQDREIPLAVWTVNLWSEIEAVLGLPGVSAVITDLPDVAKALRDRHEEAHAERFASR
jgi:glycerophosphoryl diester phosphodiesterase